MNGIPTYSVGFLWGIVLLCSFCGWGLLARRHSGTCGWFDLGIAVPTGMAIAVAAGGVLNLLAIISATSCFLFIAAGLGLFVHCVLRGWRRLAVDLIGALRRATRLQLILAVVLVLLLLVRYAGSIMPLEYNDYDDYHGYFVYPLKMLQAGSLGFDPFNGRRLVSSLGGQSFLNALYLAGAPLATLSACDGGVGYLAFALLAAALSAAMCPEATSALLVTLAASGVNLAPENISSTYVSSALVLLLLHECNEWISAAGGDNAFRLGMVAASACSVKTTCIPFVLPVVAGACAFRVIRAGAVAPGRKVIAILKGAVLPLAAMGVCLLPWMFAHWRDCGTLLYPLFGLGTHYTAYDSRLEMPSGTPSLLRLTDALVNAAMWLPVSGLVGLAALGALRAARAQTPNNVRAGSIVVCISAAGAVAGVCALNFSAGGWVFRYSLPALAAYWTFGSGVTLQLFQRAESRRFVLAGLLSLVMAAAFDAPGAMRSAVAPLRFYKFGIDGYPELASEDESRRYRHAQASAPAGSVLYAQVDKPFLLDLATQHVFVCDIPGEASPPPGLTTITSAAGLRHYFRECGVDAIAFSYVTKFYLIAQYKVVDKDPWLRAQMVHRYRHQQMLLELMSQCPILYRDEELCVIAL